MKRYTTILAVLLVAVLISAVYAGPEKSTTLELEIAQLRKQTDALEQLFIKVPEFVKPSVVTIVPVEILKTYGYRDPFFEMFFGPSRIPEGTVEERKRPRGLGSGLIIDARGYILTNNHVIGGADELIVRLADGRELEGRMVGRDPKTDIAVIKINADGLTPAKLGDSDDLKVGSWVIAVGSPLGHEQTVTQGIISAKARGNLHLAEYADFIQTDAAINPGNSGGPLVNLSGEVVGINAAIDPRSYQGLGFAIPINMAKSIMTTLIQGKEIIRGWLGVKTKPITKEQLNELGLGSTEGVYVTEVIEDSPASTGGIQIGDMIIEYDGSKISNFQQLKSRVATTPVGNMVTVTVIRQGKRVTLDVSIDAYKEDEHGSNNLGISVTEVMLSSPGAMGEQQKTKAVKVLAVDPNGMCAEALEAGDVIREYNKNIVTGLESFDKIDKTVDAEKGVRLRVLRDSRWFYIVVR